MSEESTTPDPVELTRRTFELAERRDFDGVMSFYATDVVWDGADRDLGTFEGAAATRRLFEDWFGNYDLFEIEMEEVLDFGDGIVLAVHQQHARPTGSTGSVRTREAYLYVWVENLIARVTMYRDVDEGRAAAERLAESRG
jgi:ketosteroid isomerase-like protein